MSSWTDRYEAGDHTQVWREMRSLGVELRSDPQGWRQAQAVAKMAMTRARWNVERLLALLQEEGYQFDNGEGMPVFEPPAADVSGQMDELELTVGPLPLALRAWFEYVGEVNFAGRHPGWSYEYSDPLVVAAPKEYILSEFADWEADKGTEWDRGGFTVDIAPDYLHKANVSGGPPYGVAVPNAAADGLLLWERHRTMFVDYLRIAFAWAGFPGWDRSQPEAWARPNEPTPSVLSQWSVELLPL